MENLIVESTASTPEIHFDYENKKLRIAGESFPENAVKFYEPVMEWIKRYLELTDEKQTEVEFEMIYFNSSTSKVYLTLLSLLDEAARHGKIIAVNWRIPEQNEAAEECGEEFKEDLEFVIFNIITI